MSKMKRRPPGSTLFPYTTLFRSEPASMQTLERSRAIGQTIGAKVHATPCVHLRPNRLDRKSTRLNSSHGYISYAVFCLKKKTGAPPREAQPRRGPTPDRKGPRLL